MNKKSNPFAVMTPETLSAKEIADLFIDVYTDFPKLKDVGHTFVHGARGTGKSMMLRYLEPVVQMAKGRVNNLKDLEFFAIHVPVRSAILSIEELERLDGSPYWSLAENIMSLHVVSKIFSSISSLVEIDSIKKSISDENILEIEIVSQTFKRLLLRNGSSSAEINERIPSITRDTNIYRFFDELVDLCDDLFALSIDYLKKMAFHADGLLPYDGVFCTYLGFVVPLVKKIRSIGFLPSGPIYLMLDDADNLSFKMQKIINTWVSCRTTNDICLKITTQLRYKADRTMSGIFIESPHDYNEVNIGTIYTDNSNHYYDRIKSIVECRLKYSGIDMTAEDYFPFNLAQEEAIKKYRDKFNSDWDCGAGRGSKRTDDALRYSVPEYMRNLGNSQSYSYSGFKSLVNISSGIIRWFLEPAARMYAELDALNVGFDKIDSSSQDKVIYKWSEEDFLDISLKADTSEIDVSEKTLFIPDIEETRLHLKMLRNLVYSLGTVFRSRLMDEKASERKYMSIMVAISLPDSLQQVLNLGVEQGYLQLSTIGAKESGVRKRRYVLSKRLAPYFKIDPSGHCAYLSVTEDDLILACKSPQIFIRKKGKATKDESLPDPIQASLFDSHGEV